MTQGPSARGCSASISRRSTARRKVLPLTPKEVAASVRFIQPSDLRLSGSDKEFLDDFLAQSLVLLSSDFHVQSVDHCDSALRQSGRPNRFAPALSRLPRPPGLSGCYSDRDASGVIVIRCARLPSNE